MARAARLAALLSLPFAACEPEPGAEQVGARADSLAAAVHRADAGPGPAGVPVPEDGSMALIGDSLRFTVHAPERVAPGEPVPIELRLENTAPDSVTLHLLGREIAFDILVRDAAGAVVWRRLEGAVIPQILQVRFLAPGETLTLRDAWPQRTNQDAPVPPGTYTVEGALPTDAPEPFRTGAATVRVGG
ncbi:MAG TPA: BsuPI-related putative proteinase inhibitor [Longimicrobiales bacterium]